MDVPVGVVIALGCALVAGVLVLQVFRERREIKLFKKYFQFEPNSKPPTSHEQELVNRKLIEFARVKQESFSKWKDNRKEKGLYVKKLEEGVRNHRKRFNEARKLAKRFGFKVYS